MTDSFANSISAYSTLAIAILTAAYVYVSTRTLRKIGRQAEIAEAQHLQMIRQEEYSRQQWHAMHEQEITLREQLGEMGQQTKATKRAAEAAQTSASAIMAGERAWMLVEDFAVNSSTFIRHPHFNFRFVNYGRTPAQVHGYRAYCQISASDQTPDDCSFMEGSGGIGYDPIVPPNGGLFKVSSTDMSPAFAIEPTQEEVEKIATNPPELYVWACGYVSYWDVFGKDAQKVKDLKITPFAMVYRASQSELVRPIFPYLNRPT